MLLWYLLRVAEPLSHSLNFSA